ncbi:MAG: TraC family protein [Candidatus Saccharimonadales bacterium]
MFILRKSNRRVSARQQIDIKGVKDGVLMLPNNHYRITLQVSPVNFELKSEAEQDAIIETYESFLNSVGTPLQILIRTREIDMDAYLDELAIKLSDETEPIYQTQLQNYNEFIRSLITTNKILTRHFYVVVPYDGTGKPEFELVKEQLGLTVDIVQKGLARLGMQSRLLSSLEVLDLFYSFYSPKQAKIQPLTDRALQLLHTAYIQKEAV